MARVPKDEVDRLEHETSLERLAQARGVQLADKGEQLVGVCPFHDDATATLILDRKANTWTCSVCSLEPQSVVAWTMRAEGISKRLAIELLRRDAQPSGVPIGVKRGRQQGTVAKKATTTKLSTFADRAVDDHVLLRSVVDFYRETLKQSPEAIAYLEQRGLRSSEMIEHFRIGFANRTLGYRLPHKNRKSGAELRGQLQRLGIVRESGHEHFNGSIVFPVFDAEGHVVEMYGRKITPGLRPGTPLHLYLAASRRGIWNLEAVKASHDLILCKGIIDALTFWCAGYRNVTASYGLDGFTDDHLDAFTKYETRRVFIAYDRNPAGDRAAEKLAATLVEIGIECFRVTLPNGVDVNEHTSKMTQGSNGLESLMRGAIWMGKGKRATQPVIAATVQVAAPPSLVAATDEPGDPVEANEAKAERPYAAAPPASAQGAGERFETPEPMSPPSLVLDAEPLPSEPTDKPSVDEITFRFGDRRWRIRGLSRNTTPEAMKVNILVSRDSAGFHVDTLELYSARQRAHFTKLASDELVVEEQTIKRDLGAVLLKLEEHQERHHRAAEEAREKEVKLTDEEQQAALALLRDPRLLDRILADFDKIGVVGERTNLVVGYLAGISRKLDRPLGIVIQSSSAAGKSRLMDAVLDFVPDEDRLVYSAMTGQSLFYMGEADMRHKLLAIAEDAGAERASYALKLLQSEGQLTIASTGKDAGTGRLVSQEYRVEGPVAIMMTTTAIDLDEELVNRCLVLTVDEGREQTRAIHDRQRRGQSLEAILERQERERIVKVHQDAQRLLRPLPVMNPFAAELQFADHAVRTRRDHRKYLGLIEAAALLRQYQRPTKTLEHAGRSIRYVEATKDDISIATKLCAEVLGRSLDDLPPVTRRLLGLLDELVTAECSKNEVARRDFRFSRRFVRERLGWGNTQLKVHLRRLLEAEYLVMHPSRHGRSVVYELVLIGTDGNYDGDPAGHGRPPAGPWSGEGRGAVGSLIPRTESSNRDPGPGESENARRGTEGEPTVSESIGAG